MKLRDWLKQERGRYAAMADHFDISTSAVSQWASDAGGVPLSRMREVVAFTEGQVTLDDMIPSAPVNAQPDTKSAQEAV